MDEWKGLKKCSKYSLLKPTPNLELLVNQFNNAIPENSNNPESISKYYDINEIHNIE